MMLAQNTQQPASNESHYQFSNSSFTPTNTDQKLNNDLHENHNATSKTGKWTHEEDDLLRKYVPLLGEKQWKKISAFIPGRSDSQCLHRWTKILRPGLIKGPWTVEEDHRLIAWVNTEGPNKWAQCASFMKGRSGKQCRERWFNNLNPDVKKGNWSPQEDELIYGLYQKFGSSWSKIAKVMPGRTENAIKNRFYSTLRKLSADKKKDEPERHEDLCLGEKIGEHKEIFNLTLPVPTQSALYLLLNEKTTAISSHKPVQKESAAESPKVDILAQQNEKQKQDAFNNNGEKMMVVRDMKNLKEIRKKPVENDDIDDEDSNLQDFLYSFKLDLKKPQQDITDFDSLQKNILSFCQTNIKSFSEVIQSFETEKTNSESTEIASSAQSNTKPVVQAQPQSETQTELQLQPQTQLEIQTQSQIQPQPQQSPSTMTSAQAVFNANNGPFAGEPSPNIQEMVGSAQLNNLPLMQPQQSQQPLSTMTPVQNFFNTNNASLAGRSTTNIQANYPFPATAIMNRMGYMPGNTGFPQGPYQYNPFNQNGRAPPIVRGEASNFMAGNNLVNFRNQNMGATNVGAYNWNAQLTAAPQQGYIGTGGNFRGMTVPQFIPRDGIEAERVKSLYEHLYSLEMELAKTRSDLAYYESCLKQEDVKVERIEVKQYYGDDPSQFYKSEFDEIRKKTKIE